MFFEDSSAVEALPPQLQDLMGKYPECESLPRFPFNALFSLLTNSLSQTGYEHSSGMNQFIGKSSLLEASLQYLLMTYSVDGPRCRRSRLQLTALSAQH
jgi:hypothetical protein